MKPRFFFGSKSLYVPEYIIGIRETQEIVIESNKQKYKILIDLQNIKW